MISKKQIEKNLSRINNLYNNPKNDRITVFFAKLAILEVCGWIEESMDDIIKCCANKHLYVHGNLKDIEDLIRKTHGFHYGDDFRNLLVHSVGMIYLEKLESKFDPIKFELMKSSIGILTQRRNSQAHTHIKGTGITIDSPSVTIGHFKNVYNGLKDIESCLRKINI